MILSTNWRFHNPSSAVPSSSLNLVLSCARLSGKSPFSSGLVLLQVTSWLIIRGVLWLSTESNFHEILLNVIRNMCAVSGANGSMVSKTCGGSDAIFQNDQLYFTRVGVLFLTQAWVLLKWNFTQVHISWNVDFPCCIFTLIWKESRNLLKSWTHVK